MLSLYVPFKHAIMVLRRFVYIALSKNAYQEVIDPLWRRVFYGVSFLVEILEQIANKQLQEFLIRALFSCKTKVGGDVENRRLTEKQKAFCDYYIETLNATESAIRAGYSKNSAAETGYENLRKPHIKNYIDKRLKQLEDERIAKADEVLQYLTAVMRGEEKEKFIILNDDGEEVEVEVPAKIKERTKAAELLGKRYTLFADKLDIEGTIDAGTEKLDSILKQLKED